MVDQALRTQWEEATAKLPWGVHKVFKEAFELVAEEKVKLVWGADSYNGSPCLVNSVNAMLSQKANLSPSGSFPKVVSLFDRINTALKDEGVNTDNYVSPLAAEIFLAWFAPEPPMPEPTADVTKSVEDAVTELPYREPSDEELASAWLESLKNSAPTEEEFRPCGDTAEANAFINEQHNAESL